MSHNLQKKPSRGILKTSRSVDAHDAPGTSSRTKEQRFDEMNIIETFHPADKDYGHMKIDEPKTPYAEPLDMEGEASHELDAAELAVKLTAAADAPPRCLQEQDSSEEEEETEEQRRHRFEFEKKRKMHYNEFQALQLARKLMEQDEDEEEEDEKKDCTSTGGLK